MVYKMGISFDEVTRLYRKNHRVGNLGGIKNAFAYAEEKHKGMLRGSGEPYISHPLRVARLVTEWGFESDVIMAALLHDVLRYTDTPLSELENAFGSNVAGIVDAITSLSDKDFDSHTLSPSQKALLADARLLHKISDKALYVKIADRIDNLSTISALEESRRIPKAEHTREIIIPLAEIACAYHFVDILEELCFQIEHPKLFEQFTKQYHKLCAENSRSCGESLDALQTVFDPLVNREGSALENCHQAIAGFLQEKRSCISIFRQINHGVTNIKKDLLPLFSKENVALYDLFLIIRDDFSDTDVLGIFFQYFDKALSSKDFYLLGCCSTTYQASDYFLLSDSMDNLYRLFVKTETEYRRYLYGNIIDEDSFLNLTDVNEIDPRDTYNEKIRVFRQDGSAMLIDKVSTVLDFAFYVHGDLAYHFAYAMVDDSKTQLPAGTRLNEGDRITIVFNRRLEPDITWFESVKTSRGTHHLVRYFRDVKNLAKALKRLKDEGCCSLRSQ